MKKKFVFISNMAAPYQVKKAYHLNKYFDTQFWFYTYIEEDRPKWWKIPLGNRCSLLNNVISFKKKYITFDVFKRLNEFNPDIIMIGGFTIPGNYLAYLWAKKNNKKIIVFTEVSRYEDGRLKTNNFSWKILKFLYKNVDAILTTTNKDAKKQYKFLFPNTPIFATTYGADIDEHLKHPLRDLKDKKEIVLLYANRLIDIYDPLLAIDIFNELQKKYPNIRLKMNNDGELKDKCIEKIKKYHLENKIHFLDDIKSWNDLHLVYKTSDILYLPAKFSNGNMSIIEAMASSMGIVVSNKVNGHSNILENNKNCFICNHDRDEFVKAISSYIDSPNLLKEHTLDNKSKVSYLSLESTAKKYYDIFKEAKII